MSPKMPKEYFDFRRKQILLAAWECYIEKGFKETSIRDIAKALNSSTGVIYNYFKGKDDILDALNKLALQNKEEIIQKIKKTDSGIESIKEYFKLAIEDYPSDKLRRSLRGDIRLWSESLGRKNLNEMFNSNHQILQKNLSRFIKKGINEGEILSNINPDDFARFIIAAMLGFQVQVVFLEGLDVDNHIKEFKKILFNSVLQK